MNILDVALIIIILLVGFNIKNFFTSLSSNDKKTLDLLFAYHLFASVVFHFYILTFGGDATTYWDGLKDLNPYAVDRLFSVTSAANMIKIFNYLPARILDLSFLTGNLFYATIGYIGFLFFYKLSIEFLNDRTIRNKLSIAGLNLFPFIWFLPNLHFWSSGVGKDTVLFFCVGLFLYSLSRKKKNIPGIILSLVLSLLIRPHIALFLIASFGAGYLLDGNLKIYQKIVILIFISIGFLSIFNYVLAFINLESLETESIEQFASSKAASLNSARSGSGVDISGYPFPLKVFTFLYRPFFFDINGIVAVVASFENLFLLIFTYKVLKSEFFKTIKSSNYFIKSILIYFIIASCAFALILGNLGIMMRQKNMIIPTLIIFGLYVMYVNRNKLNTVK